MSPIVSKRHPYKFYFSLIFLTLFYIAMGSAIIFSFIRDYSEGDVKSKALIMLIMGIVCFYLAGYSIYHYIKNAPIIILDKDFISFGNTTYALTEIKNVTLTGKRLFKYIGNFPMEAATIRFRNNETRFIFNDMYSNTWEFKYFLKQVVIDKTNYTELKHLAIESNELNNDKFEVFKGNQFTSIRGISLWALLILLIYMFLNNSKPNTYVVNLFLASSGLFWFFLSSYFMYYFKVSNNFLHIRNHNFLWVKKAYRITDIKEIVYETQGNMPNCLRIITKEYRDKLYPAGTLRDKDWLNLKTTLESYKIKVRNECI